jgi:hypothetical protein
MTNYQHRMKTAFESFCALVRQGITPSEIIATAAEHAPRANEVAAPLSFNETNAAIRGQRQTTATPAPIAPHQPARMAEIGDAPPPPSFSAGLNAAIMKGIVR